MSRLLPLLSWFALPVYAWQGLGVRRRTARLLPAEGPVLHTIPGKGDPVRLLREVWRVLSANGRLLAVVPNRRGLWARIDTTPFGHGRPYSRSQITRILRETMFTPKGWGEALFVPPVQRGWFLRSAGMWEPVTIRAAAPFSSP